MKREDHTGKRYHSLTGIRFVESIPSCTLWEWYCNCGRRTIVAAYFVKHGHVKSCGCYRDNRQKRSREVKPATGKVRNKGNAAWQQLGK